MFTCHLLVGSRGLSHELLGLGHNLGDSADHVESTLGVLVVLAGQDVLEAGDGFDDGHELAGVVGEHLGHLEGLGEEPLNLPGAGDLHLILEEGFI